MALYRSLLTPDGEIVMNITNRNIELTDIVAASAEAADLHMVYKRDPAMPDFSTTFRARAAIAVLARDERDFGALDREGRLDSAATRSGFPHLDRRLFRRCRRHPASLALSYALTANKRLSTGRYPLLRRQPQRSAMPSSRRHRPSVVRNSTPKMAYTYLP